jgi:serine/threonine-protein kinase HipA
MHLTTGTELSQVYDALPNLFQDGLAKWDLALAIDGIFDHRRISVERIVAEAKSWGVVAERRVELIVGETLTALGDALDAVEPPQDISAALVEHLRWNVRRLLSGCEVSEPKR